MVPRQVKVESDEKSEKTVTEEKSEKRFKSCVRKIINLNEVINVFEENEKENKRGNMADELKMTLPIFDGKDYGTWKKRITVLLKLKKCEEVIPRLRAKGDNEVTWNEKDMTAMSYWQ